MSDNRFFIEGTTKSPTIIFDKSTGDFEISGKSIPENSAEFFHPVLDWVESYITEPALTTSINIKLEYFNTSTSKSLVEIFRKFEKLFNSGSQVEINWFYEEEDEDMYESGEDYRLIVKIPVNLIKV